MDAFKHKGAAYLAICSTIVLGSCASVQASVENMSYPQDTPILIGETPYQISPIKCFEIKSIDSNGVLNCYDADGRQSSPIPPVSEYRRKILKEHMGIEWASPEHQAFLFDFFHKGGKERSEQAITAGAMKMYGNISAIKDIAQTHQAARDLPKKEAQMSMQGVQAYMSGGMTAWQQHQTLRIQWHSNNANYFLSKEPTIIE